MASRSFEANWRNVETLASMPTAGPVLQILIYGSRYAWQGFCFQPTAAVTLFCLGGDSSVTFSVTEIAENGRIVCDFARPDSLNHRKPEPRLERLLDCLIQLEGEATSLGARRRPRNLQRWFDVTETFPVGARFKSSGSV
jgi:hypothetical protein